MGPTSTLQDGGVFRAAEGLEGQLTLGTAAVVAGQLGIFDLGGQMAVIATAVPRPTGLLATWSPRGGVRRRGRGG